MKLIRHLAKKLSSIRATGPTLPPPPLRAWIRGDDLDDEGLKLHSPYTQSAWIYVAVSVLAEHVAQIPFRISRGKAHGEHLVESGPLVDLFDHPHPAMSRALFWQTLVSWEALRGEFFVVGLNEQDQPTSISQRLQQPIRRMLPLSPDCFDHIVTGYQLHGWRYTGLENTSPIHAQILLPEEVIHSRNFNPYLFWRGLSPLTVALLPAMSDYAAEQFMKGLMINNADSGVIVTSKDMFGPEQREQLLAAVNERKRSAGTADRPLFLWGDITVQKPMISSVDLQFLENRKLNRQEIGAIFKVPESMMGFAGQKSALSAGTAIEQDRLTFVEGTISALCRRLESAVEPIIKSFGADLFGWFDLESLPLLQQARRERMVTAEKAFGMGVPFNEINQVYELGFRALPWGDQGYLPERLVQIGKLPAERKGTTEGKEQKTDAIETLLARLTEYELEAAAKEHCLVEGQDGNSDSARKKAGRLRKFFFEQRGRVLAKLAQHSPGQEIAVDTLFNLDAENRMLWSKLLPLIPDGNGQTGDTRSGTDSSHTPALRPRDALADVNRETQTAISSILADQRDMGLVMERVKKCFQALIDNSETIASRTQ